MTGQNRMFDDLSKLMTNAMGVAQGAKSEADAALKSWVDRWLADRDFVTREEFEAVREMAVKARTENAELRARLDRLDPEGAARSADPRGAAPGATAPAPEAAVSKAGVGPDSSGIDATP